jgi:hypothetical protein
MPINTDLSISPYNDNYDPKKDFYKILFRPGVSVQVRELNQLQTLVQAQIERFGLNIFKQGTIVDGCSFNFHKHYNYVKLVDNTQKGTTVDPSLYVGMFANNANGLVAYVINSVDGFEAAAPDLKTIYVNLINSGTSGQDEGFTPGDLLTIYDSNNSIFSVDIDNGGLGFSNSDSLVFLSALVISYESGTFSPGEFIINPITGANVEILSIDTSTLAVSNQSILYISPRIEDLTADTANTNTWTFAVEDSIKNEANTAEAIIDKVAGVSAGGFLRTNSSGRITEIIINSRGVGYIYLPTVTVFSPNNATGLSTLELTALNFLAQVKVAAAGDSVGNGYAFSVSNGVIFQKGYFERVANQVVIVDKYSSTPNAVAVGFQTVEEIIDSNIDPSLLDNSIGLEDENAPGANRLKLTPVLTILDIVEAKQTPEFYTLVEWNDGNPYKQNQLSDYSKIGDEMSQRTFDAAGNFVLDPFLVTTVSTANMQNEGLLYTAVVDAGAGYISGRKVKTNFNFRIDVPKGLDTQIANTHKVSLNYDAFVRCKEVGGLFQFSTGDTVQLYNTAKGFCSNTALVKAGNTTPVGTQFGTARIRSMNLEDGVAGDPAAIYRLYLFDITMDTGRNFKDIRAIGYDGTYKGIADVILSFDPTTQANIAKVSSQQNDGLVFKSGLESIKNSNQATYIYRTIDQTTATGNNGILTKSIAGNPNEFFPYSGTLSNSQMQELYVVPLANNLVAFNNYAGDVTVNTTSNQAIGTATTFLTDVAAGDYLYFFPNNTVFDIKKVVSVVNNTMLVLEAPFTFANAVTNYKRTFPKNLPVPFGPRSGLTANVDANGNILTLNFGMTFDATTSTNTALGVNILRQAATSTSKTANRSQLVKLRLANNTANTVGPWCLGVSDIFRLRNVYIGDSTVNTASIAVTDDFYIDHNQNKNYFDLSFLYKKPRSELSLASADYLLIEFDYFTPAGAGYFDTVAYLHTANSEQIASLDSLPLANLSSAAASFEVPELYTAKGEHFDLLNCIDFRPSVNASATPTTNAATAPINPVHTISFGNTADPANDKKFPLSDSLFTADIEQYMGRVDSIVVGSDKNIVVIRGMSSADPAKRFEVNQPKDTLKLQIINVPPYPDVAKNMSIDVLQIISTGVWNERNLNTRLREHTITPIIDITSVKYTQPRGYNMAKIGQLERRIENLEYYTSLSLLETNLTNKIIPSSIDGSLNRFKFGMFVDDFSTTIYSDIENPQYAAGIETVDQANNSVTANDLPMLKSNLLVPPGFHWPLRHVTAGFGPAHVDFLLIDQNNATVSKPNTNPNTTPNTTPNTGIAEVSLQTNSIFYYRHFDWNLGTTGVNYGDGMTFIPGLCRHVSNLEFSTSAGKATIWTFKEYAGGANIKVYQDDVLVADNVAEEAITMAESRALLLDPYTRRFFVDPVMEQFDLDNLTWMIQEKTNKLNFNHNPVFGTNYRFVTEGVAGNGFLYYRWMLRYPMDVTINTGLIIDPDPNANPTIYWGTMKIKVLMNGAPAPDSGAFDLIEMKCTGLKPRTRHNLFLDGIGESSNVKPLGGQLGDPLVTDVGGSLTIYFYPDDLWFNKVKNAKLPQFPVPYQFPGTTQIGNSGDPILSEGYEYNFVPSYALFELKGVNSIAYDDVPLILPNKYLFSR